MFFLYCKFAYAGTSFSPDGARPVGMCNVFTAIANDETALFNNPAGLSYITKRNISVSTHYQYYTLHATWISGLKYDYSDRGIFARYIDITPPFAFGIGGGIREKGYRVDNEIQDIDTEKVSLLSFSVKLNYRLAVGISAKWIMGENKLFSQMLKDRTGIDLDIGIIGQLNEKISIGTLFQNVFKSKVYSVVYDYFGGMAFLRELPRDVNIGLGIKPIKNFLISIDVDNLLEDKVYDSNHEKDYTFKRKFQLGTELQLKNFFIREGIGYQKQANKFPMIVGRDFQYNDTIIYVIGLGFQSKSLKIHFAVNYDNRKDEIEKYKMLKVKGSTFKYFLSGSVSF